MDHAEQPGSKNLLKNGNIWRTARIYDQFWGRFRIIDFVGLINGSEFDGQEWLCRRAVAYRDANGSLILDFHAETALCDVCRKLISTPRFGYELGLEATSLTIAGIDFAILAHA